MTILKLDMKQIIFLSKLINTEEILFNVLYIKKIK